MRRRPHLDPKRRDALALRGAGQSRAAVLRGVAKSRAAADARRSVALDDPTARGANDAPMLVFTTALLALIACYFAVTLTSLHESLPAELRIGIVVLTAALAPGAAVLTLVRAAVPATVVALSIALSFAIDSLASLVLAWSGWWHPDALGAAGAGASASLLAIDGAERYQRRRRARISARGRNGRPPPSLAWPRLSRHSIATLSQFLPVPVSLALWILALTQIDRHPHLGEYGLLPALPAVWFLALALAVAGTGVVLLTRVPNVVAIVAGVGAIALILFGTIPALNDFPQYSWTYKHIGVVRFIESHGSIDPSVDIYNRWPGFFAPAAVLTSIAGVPNPAVYAAWAEVFFTWIDAVMLAAVVWSISRSKRVAGGAAMLFVMVNWVGQDYYSPQAFAFALAMGCLLPLTSGLADRGPRAATRTLAMVSRLTRSAPQTSPLPASLTSKKSALVLVLLMYASLVVSHQLSPYVLLAQVALLAALSLFHPRWLAGALAVMAISYLAVNFPYLNQHFGILDSLDPFNNAFASSKPVGQPSYGKLLITKASLVLTGIVWLGAVLGYTRLARRGLARAALPLIVMAFAPFAVLFAQSYGGEASLRVILFSSPWCVALISWALITIDGFRRRALAFAVLAGALTVLFVTTFFGVAGLNIIPPGEVRASDYLYSHATDGSAVVLASYEFPGSYGPGYARLVVNQGGSPPTLVEQPGFRDRMLTERDLPAIMRTLKGFGPHGYLVFASTEQRFVEIMGSSPRAMLPRLEAIIVHSRQFRLWYSRAGVRIYEYGFTPGVAQSQA
ncbi:MAG: hypothetical protein QOH00_1549 [Gaiellales bacterium]|nr:hypothetical protein [Gaiellales bacterium]